MRAKVSQHELLRPIAYLIKKRLSYKEIRRRLCLSFSRGVGPTVPVNLLNFTSLYPNFTTFLIKFNFLKTKKLQRISYYNKKSKFRRKIASFRKINQVIFDYIKSNTLNKNGLIYSS